MVSFQPVTTRPASCRTCHLLFAPGETRICPEADVPKSAWTHIECARGGLTADRNYKPHKPVDIAAVNLLLERVRAEAAEATTAYPAEPPAVEVLTPPDISGELPSQLWFSGLDWDEMATLRGPTFVQLPRRMEQAFADAMAPALRLILAEGSPSEDRLAGWKAFLLLPWLLLRVPQDPSETETCGTLLLERLDRLWTGDAAALFREAKADCSCYAAVSRAPVEDGKAIAKRVRTLARSGEIGRAILAASPSSRVKVTPTVVGKLRAMYPSSDNMEVDASSPLQNSLQRPTRKGPRSSPSSPAPGRSPSATST